MLNAQAQPDSGHIPRRADLILAPGRTWDVRVGEVMHAQAAIRADEVGSLAMWCDRGGLSGVVGRGESGVQRGVGSFVRTVAMPFTPDANDDGRTQQIHKPTFYARTGDWFALVMMWVPVATAFWLGATHSSGTQTNGAAAANKVSAILEPVRRTLAVGGSAFPRALSALRGAAGSLRGRFTSTPNTLPAQSQNLIDV